MAIGISNVRGKQSRSAISSPISTPVTKMKTQHELRYEDFVLSTSSKSLDALNDSLNESSDAFSFIVFPASMSRSLPTPPRYHTAFLSDLRLRKIYEGEKGVRSQIGVLGKLSWPSSGPEGYFKALLWQFRKVKILFPTLTNTTHLAN